VISSWHILPGGIALELTDSLKSLFIETAKSLKGSARRLFMARTVKELGPGGQRRAERELGWGRMTIRKGTHELESGFTCLDAFSARGRKRVETHLPHLMSDIRAIVDSQSQADPQFRTNRLYTRLSAAEVRRQLITHKGYSDDTLPTVQTITTKLNALGYYPKKVAKSQPQKKSLKPMRSSTR
jgi:Rhodopirellula transposase DDE domain